jgi:phosphoesterase RecJ-like protein
MSLKKVIAEIKRHKRFLVTTHSNPEGDALGAELVVGGLLRSLGKQVSIVNDDPVPREYAFLPDVGRIIRFSEFKKGGNFDCLLLVDCSDISRCGKVQSLRQSCHSVINIDHHISNTLFGEVNWVGVSFSSASEMVYRLCRQLDYPLTSKDALLLYVGIMTDTGSFRYSNTTADTHAVAADLLSYGIPVNKVYNCVYGNIPYEDMRLLSKVLLGLKQAAGGKIVWAQVEKNILRKSSLSFDVSEYILSFARAIKGAEVVVLFKENFGGRHDVRVNFRSHGRIDVNKIACYFGGGGHKTASGCTLAGSLVKIRKTVLRKVTEVIAKKMADKS